MSYRTNLKRSKNYRRIAEILESEELSDKFKKDVNKGQSAIMLKYIYKLRGDIDIIVLCEKLNLNHNNVNWLKNDPTGGLPYVSLRHVLPDLAKS